MGRARPWSLDPSPRRAALGPAPGRVRAWTQARQPWARAQAPGAVPGPCKRPVSYIYLYNSRRSSLQGLSGFSGALGFFGPSRNSKTLHKRAFSALASRNLGSGSLRGHLARENSARGHFEATWLEKPRLGVVRLGVTSRPLGSRKLGSGSLRGHLARENLARGHFEGTCLEKLGSGSLRGHLTRGTSVRSHFEATWLEKTVRGNYSKKLLEGAVTAPLSSASLHSASSKTRMDILGFTLFQFLYRR